MNLFQNKKPHSLAAGVKKDWAHLCLYPGHIIAHGRCISNLSVACLGSLFSILSLNQRFLYRCCFWRPSFGKQNASIYKKTEQALIYLSPGVQLLSYWAVDGPKKALKSQLLPQADFLHSQMLSFCAGTMLIPLSPHVQLWFIHIPYFSTCNYEKSWAKLGQST